ncbi:J domain-containing protein [Aspergillus lucknowensis]|uniref:J domain-containing protein n=1 Tax=Aspergillus lucknowensis TaxID=176173 RepID=A0ABR4LRG0_9EURO
MLRKPKIICYNGLLLLSQPYPSAPVSRRTFSRPYATAHGDCSEKDLSWPSSSSFTPYDVIGQARGAPYSKHRFYELVKIYHPDRPCNGHPLCKDISPEVRLQRYRIVITAHEILSDPTRRAAYDQTGMGWSFNPATSSRARTGPYPDPVYANATWEDWERWYNRDQPKQQTIVDHGTFVAFVVLLFFLGGALQASWLTHVNTGYEDRLRELNEQSTRFLNERRKNTVSQMASSDAKVQHFLVRRDPSGYGLKGEEEHVYQKALNPRNTPLASGEAELEKDTHPEEDESDHTTSS